ncbi:hypothetical protein CHCC14820_0502 [Bacillus paralicheniformis]|uniref:Uncharacterized protein n=1 Tax=Bacillus paralicheniformis TaxID=1648923 RepID=A0ABY3FT00_9BACI|nr:hypothetical protein SC10_B2orf06073 [Bacillus paralicheniformis]OLG13250.1 hypothetical protein B4123_0338 [Bacillus paralicheniformis]TWJ75357.1 hypothetical protein CHCC5019_2028 [Bacillus paralicheniformis]TWJ76960.1 hypothetical protein CHCC20497_0508 [Bacillus paralicheniformis]TWK26538.1 hypothetical protein CHCC20372_1582 [Bacillus paralicheniformis]
MFQSFYSSFYLLNLYHIQYLLFPKAKRFGGLQMDSISYGKMIESSYNF